jgi:hypothetical protein
LLSNIEKGNKPEIESLKKMKIGKLRRLFKKAGFDIKQEKLYYPTGFDKILPRFMISALTHFPLTRNFVVNTYKSFLIKNNEIG